MQLRQNVDYGYLQGTFPSKTKRFENLGALSLSPQDNGTAAGCESNRLFLVSGPSKACFRKGPEPETDKRPSAAAAVPLPCKDPPGGHRDAASAAPRNLAHRPTGSRLSRQTAAHRHRLWATGTPIPVRQGPISACGAPQSPALRAEPASRCGCLATVRVTSRKQGRHPQKWAKMKVTYPKQGRHPQSAPFPFPKLSLSICRTKRKKPYLPKRNQATSEL